MMNNRKRKHKKGSKKNFTAMYLKRFAKSEAIFSKWLKKNEHRLHYKLINKGSYCYSFEGLIKEIELSITLRTTTEIEFVFNYNGCCFDLETIAYIGEEAYNPQKGYYDLDRVDKIYTYYPTREELYINDVFEWMIKKCNEKLTPNNSLYLFDYNGITSAYIQATQEDDKNNLKVIRNLSTLPNRKDLSLKEAKKLFKEEKVYKVIKLDLFNKEKNPFIRYYNTNIG
jgi:hypothetical protein